MRSRVGRLQLFFLCFCLSLSISHAASFTDCFSPDPLNRFWSAPSFYENNPYIGKILFFKAYSFQFDNSSASLQLENISIMDGAYLNMRVPRQKSVQFSQARAYLDGASSSLEAAKTSQRNAHALYLPAKKVAEENFGFGYLFFGAFLPASPFPLYIALNFPALSDYITDYPQAFSSTLENSAKAADFSARAGFDIAQKADEQYALLKKAGAGSAGYSGSAKETFLYAQSLLAGGSGFCASGREKSNAVHGYFSLAPQMPDFSRAGFSDYLSSTAGKGEDSSIMRIASLYLLLSDANEAMESDYCTSILSAQTAYDSFSLSLSQLDGEELSLIGNPYRLSEGASEAVAGSEYSGIENGIARAKSDLARSKLELSAAQYSHSSRTADGYIALAMQHAKASEEISRSASASLMNIRTDAESAVFAQKKSAQAAMDAAKQASAQAAGQSFSDAQLQAQGSGLLLKAEEEFFSANGENRLGRKFSLFASSQEHASQALALFSGRAGSSLMDSVRRELISLSSLISAAGADGLDVSYERERLAEYEKLLSLSQSPQTASAILSSIESDRASLILRLSEMYNPLPDSYSSLSSCAGGAGASDANLQSQLASISRYFRSGEIALPEAAGRLSSLQKQVISLKAECEKGIPAYLSSLLSKNARVSEISGPAILGQPSASTLFVSTQNPSGFGYSGKLAFYAQPEGSFLSSDFAGGDEISDAFMDSGKLRIELFSISPGQQLSFKFMKNGQAAQITSADDACASAGEDEAAIVRKTGFFTVREIDSLGILEQVPALSHDAHAKYAGKTQPLLASSRDGGDFLSGSIEGVSQGKNSLEISYSVHNPFSLSIGERSYETLPAGQKRISYTLSISESKIACGNAQVSAPEPFTSITNLSISPLSNEKITNPRILPIFGGSELHFAFSPLQKGATQKFIISYVVQNYSDAVSEALLSAEFIVRQYNRTRDALSLSQAKELISAGRQNEALTLLSGMLNGEDSISKTGGDYLLFIDEKSESEAKIGAASSFLAGLESENLTEEATQLSSIIFKYSSSLTQSKDEADAGGYEKALSILRKAKGEFALSLASLSWKILSDAQGEYAKASKAGVSSDALSNAALLISESQTSHSQQDYEASLLLSAKARREISIALANSSESKHHIAG